MGSWVHIHCVICRLRIAVRPAVGRATRADEVELASICMECWPRVRGLTKQQIESTIQPKGVQVWLRPMS